MGGTVRRGCRSRWWSIRRSRGGTIGPPRIPWSQTIIYEVHVKGFTARHPDVPEDLRGTYAGLVSPGALSHLKSLGVTAVELMPIHQFVADKHLVERGLTNYWGYNSIGFFAPDIRYASAHEAGAQVNEFKTMVKILHEEGIEVILDVVYNHTAEGNHLGPTLCFRGLDNAAYYRLNDDRRYYMDYTGCGNTLDMTHPRALQLIMDSLRYWIQEMHVDGFRFDLASALARELHDVDRLGSFFDIIHQDPVISQVKLIAEPWDLGEGGYQVGNFPEPLGGVERHLSRHRARLLEGRRGSGRQHGPSADRLQRSVRARWPAALRLDQLRDRPRRLHARATSSRTTTSTTRPTARTTATAHDHNLSWNYGVEGPTDDVKILELRERQTRNFLATLLLSQGVPMICAGDEIGRTQHGNNNAYCQDNELSWLDWRLDGRRKALLAFTRFAHPAAASPPGASPQAVLLRSRDPLRGQGPDVVTAGRPGDDRGRLEQRADALLRSAARQATPSRTWTTTATGSWTTRS